MSTETLSFGLLGPEKNAFKDGNPTLKIITKWSIFWKQIYQVFWLLTDVLRDGSPCTNEYPKQQVSSKTARTAKRIKKKKYLE